MHRIVSESGFHIDEITKVEGAASLHVHLFNGKVKDVQFKIHEYKRFYTKAMEGKHVLAIPQLLARICGTCSNAHLTAAIEAVEKTFGLKPSEQTMILRKLTYHGLIIRDHALHLYLFALPDLFDKGSLLQFDETDPRENQLLHDAFEVKGAGNRLSILVAGRSVHAPYPIPGGFSKIPNNTGIPEIIKKLKDARPAVLRLIKIFQECEFSLVRKTDYIGLVADPFSFLEGEICNTKGICQPEPAFRNFLDHVVIPYSHASGYTFQGGLYRVGSLARMNLSRHTLHQRTKKDAAGALKKFPSDDIFHNNLAQAIEILHSIDESVEILQNITFHEEKPIPIKIKKGTGVGVVEAPRGTLYHKLEVNEKGIVKRGEVIVPTGQNQISIEKDIGKFVEDHLDMDKEKLSFECEKIIRAYDPCMSCASHFLKLEMHEE